MSSGRRLLRHVDAQVRREQRQKVALLFRREVREALDAPKARGRPAAARESLVHLPLGGQVVERELLVRRHLDRSRDLYEGRAGGGASRGGAVAELKHAAFRRLRIGALDGARECRRVCGLHDAHREIWGTAVIQELRKAKIRGSQMLRLADLQNRSQIIQY